MNDSLWAFIYLLFLIGMVVEAGREAFGTDVSAHFTRMMPFSRTNRPPRDFWTEPRTRREKMIHQHRWHIDLLNRTQIQRLKK
jgi:hypothetical protein